MRTWYKVKANKHETTESGEEATADVLAAIDNGESKINAYKCNIGISGTKKICEKLKYNTTVHELVISDNSIGDDGLFFVLDLLNHNSTLRLLGIGDNEISDFGLEQLTTVKNTTLESIALNWNFDITDKSYPILEKFCANSNIKILYLDNTNLRDSLRLKLHAFIATRDAKNVLVSDITQSIIQHESSTKNETIVNTI